MSFVLVAGAMTALAVALLVVPLLRARPAPPRKAFDLEVYRDQLKEVERDLERGLIGEREARAARIEIERRILQASERADKPAAPPPPTRARLAAALVAVLVPAVAGGLYLHIGAPHLPDRPLHARSVPGQEAHPEIAELVQRLEARLAQAPDDVRGWRFLGRTQATLGRLERAAAAYERALALEPGDADTRAALAEVLVLQAGGAVTGRARDLFEAVLAERPESFEARYYVGLADAQAGNLQRALERWRALLADAPADASWRPAVEAAFRELAADLGYDGAAMLAELPGAEQAPVAPRGPSAADMARAAEMAAGDREAMIRSMVDGLAARLEAEPDDIDGWLRLARARAVLGEDEAAFKAFERALALAPEDPEVLKAYADAHLGPPDPLTGVPQIPEEAAELYARAAEAAPEDPQPVWYLGLHALQNGDRAGAIERWRQVLALLDPSDPDYRAVQSQLEALGR